MPVRRFFALLAVMALVLSAAAVLAQGHELSAEYRVSIGGKAAGTEKGTVTRLEDRTIYTSVMGMSYPQAVSINATLEVANNGGRPLAYRMEAKVSGAIQRLEATFGADTVDYRAEHAGGVQTGLLRLHPGYIVWENNLWTMLTAVLARVGTGPGPARLYVLVPTAMREFALSVEDRGVENLIVEGGSQSARHWTLVFADALIMEVWADLENRMPVKIRVPAQQLEVTRAAAPPPAPAPASIP